MISDKGVSVWIDAGLDLLWQRVRHKNTRPLLRTSDPRQTLTELYEARVPIYRLADLSVRSEPQFSIEDTARAVLETLRSRDDVLEANP